MKIKTPAQIYDPNHTVSGEFVKQSQAMADDIRSILKGGLSFSDAQLPFQYKEVNVTSGQPVNLQIQAPYTIIGAFPIQTYGLTIASITSNLSNYYTITLTFSGTRTTGRIGFLLIGVNA